MTPRRTAVVEHVAANPGATAPQIARALAIHPRAATSRLRWLVNHGHVTAAKGHGGGYWVKGGER